MLFLLAHSILFPEGITSDRRERASVFLRIVLHANVRAAHFMEEGMPTIKLEEVEIGCLLN